MSREERDEVPTAMSSCSTSAARIPRDAASRSAPTPTMPPPTITTSHGPATSAARSRRRWATASCAPVPASVMSSLRSWRGRAVGDPPEEPGRSDDQDQDHERSMEDDRLEIRREEAREHRRTEDDPDGDGCDEEDLAPAGLPPARRLSHDRPPRGCRSARRAPCPRTPPPDASAGPSWVDGR